MILQKLLLNRLELQIDPTLREYQEGFRRRSHSVQLMGLELFFKYNKYKV